nr:PREDICTED: venom carboxylesterase-6-like [Bemisia tabaci]XP_018902231.1 PREDICTED: venom carboxylesterase-6-like [Bemisia tabaci]
MCSIFHSCSTKFLFTGTLKQRVLSVVSISLRSKSDYPEVVTDYGKLRGAISTSRNGRKFLSFSGIPYAEAPVGSLRFKPPVPCKGWEGTRDATKEGNVAVQASLASKKIFGDEDCLFANIYTPECDGPLKPVLVWIHEGAFVVGSGSALLYGAHFFMDYDIVLVTFNYRLGVLGFLNLDLEDAAGNMGMKDQVLLLKWVQKEIKNFGGDSNNVTLGGSSAGGACVHHHMISPMSRGLFHKAIAQSGTLPGEWAFMKHHQKIGLDLGKHLSFDAKNKEELLKHLMTVPAKQLIEVQDCSVSQEKHFKGNDFAFLPSLETVGSDRFVSSDPHELIVSKNPMDIPFLTGVNLNDGFLILQTIKEWPHMIKTLNTDLRFLFEDLVFPPSLTSEEITKLASRIRRHYFGEETIEYPKHFHELVDLYGTLIVQFPAILTLYHLKNKPRKSPIFFYKFSVDTPFGWYTQLLIKRGLLEPGKRGAAHCDELGYLFSCAMNAEKPLESGSLADMTISRMTKMWTNFAVTGDPSADIKWKPTFSTEYEKPMGLKIGEELVFEPIKEFDLLSTFKELVRLPK